MPDQSSTAAMEHGTSPDEQTRHALFQEVRDAALLLEFAVSQGRVLEKALIPRIKRSQGFLSNGVPWPSDEDRSEFESAYRDLAQAMQPVTAATLKATQDAPGKVSPARKFSWQLYFWVFLCAAFIIFDQILTIPNLQLPLQDSPISTVLDTKPLTPEIPVGGKLAPGAAEIEKTNKPGGSAVTQKFLPFVFGLVGALTFLLRSAHAYIAERTFDLNRRPEYYNRMVLGFLGGGSRFCSSPLIRRRHSAKMPFHS